MDLHGANENIEHREEIQNSNQNPLLVISATVGPRIEETDKSLEGWQLTIFITVVDHHEKDHEVKYHPENQSQVIFSSMRVVGDGIV